jgi:hypothetical protein
MSQGKVFLIKMPLTKDAFTYKIHIHEAELYILLGLLKKVEKNPSMS